MIDFAADAETEKLTAIWLKTNKNLNDHNKLEIICRDDVSVLFWDWASGKREY